MREGSLKTKCHQCHEVKRCKLVQVRAVPDPEGRLFEYVCVPCARPLRALKSR
jgi:hypothetical protein